MYIVSYRHSQHLQTSIHTGCWFLTFTASMEFSVLKTEHIYSGIIFPVGMFFTWKISTTQRRYNIILTYTFRWVGQGIILFFTERTGSDKKLIQTAFLSDKHSHAEDRDIYFSRKEVIPVLIMVAALPDIFQANLLPVNLTVG